MRALLVFFVVALPALPALAQSAAQLNSQGFDLYKKGQFAEAIAKFREATEKDGKHALAHYNLAATLARVRNDGQVCNLEAYRSTIIAELKRSIELDPRRRKRALEDNDFASVHDTAAWQFIAGKTVEKNGAEILQAVSWYGPSPGAYGPSSGLRFLADGKVDGWYLDLSGDDVKRVARAGRWKLAGRQVTIEWAGGAADQPKRETWTLDASGRLVATAPNQHTYTDDPDECSA